MQGGAIAAQCQIPENAKSFNIIDEVTNLRTSRD
jgi:hypothetical protein